jgi:tetrapyrrole methylase family protein/MazG family protein
MERHMLTPGRILDLAVALFEIEPASGVQVHSVAALLSGAVTPGLPAEGAAEVASWAQTQGLGPYTPPFVPFPLRPTTPAVLHSATPPDLPALTQFLRLRYPAEHLAHIVTLDAQGAPSFTAERELAALTTLELPVAAAYLIGIPALPASADQRGLEGLHWVVTRLLGPGGCPWDVRQTHQSLRAALLEETHEVLEAIDGGDMHALAEELGDLLISIVGHSEMARQAGHFRLEDVLELVTSKLIGRHPHVFGDLSVDGEGQVLHNWEQIKAAELAAKGKARASALDGIPPTLPALAAAQKLGKKAARTGFNWQSVDQVWNKVAEELSELRSAATANDRAAIAEEFGDLLFVLGRLAAWLEIDAETTLREANAKFRRRFTAVEQLAAERGLALNELDGLTLLKLWNTIKAG